MSCFFVVFGEVCGGGHIGQWVRCVGLGWDIATFTVLLRWGAGEAAGGGTWGGVLENSVALHARGAGSVRQRCAVHTARAGDAGRGGAGGAAP